MTRLEVSVAVVMATIVAIAASFFFKVLERSAGNARAMEKILAFRQTVEEYASVSNGYPDGDQVRSLWARNRERDYLFSPWGGHVGFELDQATGTRGVATVAFLDIERRQAGGLGRAGGIGYLVTQDPGRSVRLYDVTNNTVTVVRYFGCFYFDPAGTYPHFPAGGGINR